MWDFISFHFITYLLLPKVAFLNICHFSSGCSKVKRENGLHIVIFLPSMNMAYVGESNPISFGKWIHAPMLRQVDEGALLEKMRMEAPFPAGGMRPSHNITRDMKTSSLLSFAGVMREYECRMSMPGTCTLSFISKLWCVAKITISAKGFLKVPIFEMLFPQKKHTCFFERNHFLCSLSWGKEQHRMDRYDQVEKGAKHSFNTHVSEQFVFASMTNVFSQRP